MYVSLSSVSNGLIYVSTILSTVRRPVVGEHKHEDFFPTGSWLFRPETTPLLRYFTKTFPLKFRVSKYMYYRYPGRIVNPIKLNERLRTSDEEETTTRHGRK